MLDINSLIGELHGSTKGLTQGQQPGRSLEHLRVAKAGHCVLIVYSLSSTLASSTALGTQ